LIAGQGEIVKLYTDFLKKITIDPVGCGRTEQRVDEKGRRRL
jgi:hypothetical protein